MISFHTWSTPDGRKVSILLEEMELAYDIHLANLSKNEQFSPAFLAISPNNKIRPLSTSLRRTVRCPLSRAAPS